MAKYLILLVFFTACAQPSEVTCGYNVARDGREIPVYINMEPDIYDHAVLQKGADLWKEVGVNFVIKGRGEAAGLDTIIVENISEEHKKLYWGFTGGQLVTLSDEIPLEYLAAVMAHELGHSMNLLHVDDQKWPGCHLMNSIPCPLDKLSDIDLIMYERTTDCLNEFHGIGVSP